MDNISKIIDHTLLRADAKEGEILTLIEEAKKYKFASVCVNPTWVSFANERLKNSDVKVCTVIGFPLGATTKEVKAFETTDAIKNGADEVDMVINIGALKSGNLKLIEEDIKAVVDAASKKAIVKVIIETCFLTNEEKIEVCSIAKRVGADFVKTSTGFGTGGATREDVALIRKTVGSQMGIKASGGVRNSEDLNAMIEAGATRIGTSSGTKLVCGEESNTNY